MLAERSYDDDDLRRYIVAQGAEPVIPGRRNLVEQSIGRLKQGRRIATRYEKTAASYPGFVPFDATRQWLCNPFC